MKYERISRAEIVAYKQQTLERTVLIRLEEAAEILAIHPRTLQRRVEEGRIVAYNDNRTSKGVRFLASELRRYVAEMRIDTSAELGSLAGDHHAD